MFGNLRLVATDKLHEYRANTDLFIEVGNEAFAAAIRSGIRRSGSGDYKAPWLLYHSWRQPRIQVDDHSAGLIRELMAGQSPGPAHQPIVDKLRQLGWCDDHEPVDLDELVKRSQDYFLAIQNPRELRIFLERVRQLRPRLVVEIGTARGGMLYCFSQLATADATLVSIDLPGAPNCGGQTETERAVFATFGPLTQGFHFIPEDSHLASTRQKLDAILAGRQADLLFIDGDHSYEGCIADFTMYRDIVAPHGLIVFHDICLFPEEWPGTGVGPAWKQVQAQYGGEEIIDADGVTSLPLQPGQHCRWGIGVLPARLLQGRETGQGREQGQGPGRAVSHLDRP